MKVLMMKNARRRKLTDKYSAESDYDEDADLEFYYREENEK